MCIRDRGICITDEYVLITSYSDDKGSLGELMVFDREDGEYLVTLGMDANLSLIHICLRCYTV